MILQRNGSQVVGVDFIVPVDISVDLWSHIFIDLFDITITVHSVTGYYRLSCILITQLHTAITLG